jgi:hypothetical protein
MFWLNLHALWLRTRTKPAPLPPAKSPATTPELDRVRGELANCIGDADRRLDQVLERLRAREAKRAS